VKISFVLFQQSSFCCSCDTYKILKPPTVFCSSFWFQVLNSQQRRNFGEQTSELFNCFVIIRRWKSSQKLY